MASWSGQSGLLASCHNERGENISAAMIDPSREENYAFLEEFFDEQLDTFPDRWIHLGGDEAQLWMDACWARNPKIRAFMTEKYFASVSDLEHYHIERLAAIIARLFAHKTTSTTGGEQRKMVFWDEVYALMRPVKFLPLKFFARK